MRRADTDLERIGRRGVAPAPLCRSNCKALRMPTATRSVGVPLGAAIGGISTAANLSCTPSPPGRAGAVKRLPAAGGQPGRRSAPPRNAPARRAPCHWRRLATTLTIRPGTMITFLGDLPSSAFFTASSARTAASISALLASRGDRHFRPLFAVNLYRQRQRVLDQKVALDRGPGGFRHQRLVAEHGPAFLGEVRHHRCKELHKNINRFVHGPAQVAQRGEALASLSAPSDPISPIAPDSALANS